MANRRYRTPRRAGWPRFEDWPYSDDDPGYIERGPGGPGDPGSMYDRWSEPGYPAQDRFALAYDAAVPSPAYGDPARQGPLQQRRAQSRGTARYPGSHRSWSDRAADEVASWVGDEEAEQRREEDHRGKGPKNYLRSDERIEEDVNDELTEHHALDATDIAVSVSEREVTLDGYVDSRRAKRTAEDCADAVSGVEHVQNNLRIRRALDESV